MNAKAYVQRYGARLLSSHGLKQLKRSVWHVRQALTAGQPTVDIWLRAADPYSYLLAQVLPSLQSRFRVNWRMRVIHTLQQDMYPEPQMWQHNALLDARLLAELYQLPAPEIEQPSLAQIDLATNTLLQLQQQAFDAEAILAVFDALWSQQEQPSEQEQPLLKDPSQSTHPSICQQQLEENEAQLRRDGHYLGAMLKFQGEWYWGLDRLVHLEQRCNELQLNQTPPEIQFDKTFADFCRPFDAKAVDQAAKQQPLTLYFSIRSPYSHLGLEQAVKLTQHYGIPLVVKPVLPMLMRGLSVPDTKKFYIFHDTKREADKLGIDYGFVADPLGLGVERCYALFEYAQQENKAIEYLLSYARGVNAEGILSETDAGLKIIVERAGLSWSEAQAILTRDDWRTSWRGWAEDNREEMVSRGQWGVPTFSYQDLTLWGQDRVEFIEQKIRQQLSVNM